ncbi:Alpha/Beta hydrolase protein [Mycena polygramma]|nr:Alpha/Beta hydrolase protein [Mycena polygramma]
MLDLTLNTPTGSVVFNYVISTPTQTSALSVDASLPTVLFLHPIYLGKIIYHLQFADRELRRFNLIALDLRRHGESIGKAGKGYGREVAARDVALFMATLKIPQYHLFGMSMGGDIALQTAILFPAYVLSIFVVSCLPLTEPPEVCAGLEEICEVWSEGIRQQQKIQGHEAGSLMGEAFTGTVQLSMNGHPTKVFQAMLQVSMPFAMSQWGIDGLDDFRTVCVDFFTSREAFTADAMRNINCPVYLVHCEEDVAYTMAGTQQLADHLRAAGVSVEVREIPHAPHFGVVSHAKQVNALFHGFILSVCPNPPPIPDHVESPFKAQLAAAGCDSDSDDDELLISIPY